MSDDSLKNSMFASEAASRMIILVGSLYNNNASKITGSQKVSRRAFKALLLKMVAGRDYICITD